MGGYDGLFKRRKINFEDVGWNLNTNNEEHLDKYCIVSNDNLSSEDDDLEIHFGIEDINAQYFKIVQATLKDGSWSV